jgi:triacylglycerol lipase
MSFFVKLRKERYSPRAFDEFSLANDFSLGTGKALAWVSQLAYETDEPDKIKDILSSWEMRLVDDGVVSKEVETALPTVSTHCFVAGGRGATIVAFAGTDPAVSANWVTDFDAHLEKTGAARGYSTAASAVWPELAPLIAKTAAANGKVFVTGHSLGGALAALTALKIGTDSVADVQAVYTFGMPRPGDDGLAETYNTRLGQCTYRLVHGDDVVPTVAPTSLGFRHVGRYLRCERGGKFAVANLTADARSDDPQFIPGISKELAGLSHAPVSNILSVADRLRLAAALAIGFDPGDLRTDPGGIAIELLPPRIRDHMPDRYIGGF